MPSDTQLERWQVFKQDAPGKPHAAVGSVHAAGAEHALLMARTVFARRPATHSLWLAPDSAVHQFTREQFGAQPPEARGDATRYLVFLKTSDRRGMTACEHTGEVSAAGPAAALLAALQAPTPLGVWLVEAGAVVASDPADAGPWFEPAKDKRYKLQSEYAVPVKRHGRAP